VTGPRRRFRAGVLAALLVLGPGAAHGAIVLVQSAQGASAGDANTISATFASQPGAGNLLVAVAGNLVASTPSTPAGWSVAIDEAANAPGQVIFYRIAAAIEPTAVTVNGYSTATRLGLHVYEYRGIAYSAPLDQTASNTGNGTALATGTTAATSQAVELVLAAFVIDAAGSLDGWTNGFTERRDFANGGAAPQAAYAGADLVVSDVGGYSSDATAALAGSWRGQIVTFKARRVMFVE
jgi:hypothetical protein